MTTPLLLDTLDLSSQVALGIILGVISSFVLGFILAIWSTIPDENLSLRNRFFLFQNIIGRSGRAASVFVAIVLLVVLIVVFRPDRQVPTFLSTIDQYSAVLSLLLTGLLVLFYAVQSRSLRRQIGIVEDQVNYARADHQPEIVIEEWSVDGNVIPFTLSNVGNGIAKELRFEVMVSNVSGNEYIKIVSTDSGVRPEPLVRGGASGTVDYLQPGEQHVSFSTKAVVPRIWEDSMRVPISFSDSLVQIREQADDEQPRIFVQPVLRYDNIAGEAEDVILLTEIINSVAISDFQDAMSTEYKFGLAGDFSPPQNHLIYTEGNEYQIVANTNDDLMDSNVRDLPVDSIAHE